jgi:uncharacterized membrane protein SpoIIM required for sporulation
MDIDAFSAIRAGRWARLRELSGSRRLTGAEADEFTRLYQMTAGDLGAVRSAAPEPGLITWLSVQLANARVWLTGAHEFSIGDVKRVFSRTFPAALYRVRWWSVGVSAFVIAGSVLSAFYALHTPGALDLVAPPEVRAQIAQQEFASYYTEYDSTSFGAQVWTNNAWLSTLVIGTGIVGYLPAVLMYNTALQLGVAAAIMSEAGMLDVFFKLIIPHGLLELSAVFTAAGAGIRLFWTALVPGARTRSRALAEEGRIAIAVAGVLVVTLFVSGLIEGYVTGSAMVWWLKIAIGSVLFVAFWVYTFVAGRLVTREGATGDAEGDFAVAVAPVAG